MKTLLFITAVCKTVLLFSCLLLVSCNNKDSISPDLAAKFELSDSIVNEGSTIIFTDISEGSPVNWEWTFEGGTPTTSTDPNPSITFTNPGVYDVKLTISKNEKSDTYSAEEQIIVLPISGLIAYYPFNGNTFDISGNNYNGSPQQGASLVSDRYDKQNQAYDFDGIDDYIVTSTLIDDHLESGTTFSAWVFLNEVGSTARILSNYNGTGAMGNCNERIGFVFGVTKDRNFNIFYAIDGNDYDGRMTALGELVSDKWYHIVGTWEGGFTSTDFRLYINGIRSDVEDMETGSVSCGEYLESSNPFHIGIGHCGDGFCAPFNGKIDEVRIYNYPLEEKAIQALSKY